MRPGSDDIPEVIDCTLAPNPSPAIRALSVEACFRYQFGRYLFECGLWSCR